MSTVANSEVIQILDICMQEPDTPPDRNAISAVAAGSSTPIALLSEVVRLLWLAAERPEDFDGEVNNLYG